MKELDFVKTALHGCAYGLRDRKGNFIQKPWTIASTLHGLIEGLERRCDDTHDHVEARGKDCKSAEYFTDAFAQQVHVVISRAAERSLSSRHRP
eukprot:7545872-Pyramimonas_sp.AAC.1